MLVTRKRPVTMPDARKKRFGKFGRVASEAPHFSRGSPRLVMNGSDVSKCISATPFTNKDRDELRSRQFHITCPVIQSTLFCGDFRAPFLDGVRGEGLKFGGTLCYFDVCSLLFYCDVDVCFGIVKDSFQSSVTATFSY